MKYDIVIHEGKPVSVTVFHAGKSYIATKEHPSFKAILDKLQDAAILRVEPNAEDVVSLFDVTIPLTKNFESLSERVSINAGRIFFDGDPMLDGLADAIVKFYAEHNDNFRPLVAFMEKIATNPNEHSRQHLFWWLGTHRFSIAPDGDFYAYKGVRPSGLSEHSGEAIVNGVLIRGQIPNTPDTIIEMPRSKVRFDPRQGCSTGLHVANWDFAKGFLASGKYLLVKINPRDVVSVPVDAGGDKMRVCRYRVVREVTTEFTDALLANEHERLAKAAPVAPATTKKKSAAKAKPEVELPQFYDEFYKRHFEACPVAELRWLGREWGVKGASKMPVPALIDTLTKMAAADRKLRKVGKLV